jgi:flagellar biosynthesis/type III secretory pathway protein FliH
MSKIIKQHDARDDLYIAFERQVLIEPEPEPEGEEAAAAPEDQAPPEPEGPTPEEILAEARAEAQRVVREAYSEGYRRGEAAGKAAFLQSVGEAAVALKGSAEAMAEARRQFLAATEPQVVALVKAIAQRVLHREIQTDEALVVRTVRAALANLTAREHMVLRLNPADIETFRKHELQVLEAVPGVNLDVVEDESVGSGGCIIDTESLHVDARLDQQLREVLDALLE